MVIWGLSRQSAGRRRSALEATQCGAGLMRTIRVEGRQEPAEVNQEMPPGPSAESSQSSGSQLPPKTLPELSRMDRHHLSPPDMIAALWDPGSAL